jgi:hypothetical protein
MGSTRKALLLLIGIPLLMLGILFGAMMSRPDGSGVEAIGILAALVGFVLCSVAFIYRK